ncbi:MAG: hypothetical protein AB7Q17_15600 [Phycisphaerae bacterium]
MTQRDFWLNGARGRDWLLLAIVHAVVAWYYVSNRAPGTDAARVDFPLDDSWIHLVYARSLVEEGVPAYNPGVAEAGFTSPLWILVCAAAHLLARVSSLDVVLAVKVLGAALAWLATLGLYELLRAWTRAALLPLFGGLLCAASPTLSFSQVAGMEVNLAAGCALWMLLALHHQRFLAAGVLLAAAYWSRPETLLLAPLVGIGQLIAWRFRFDRARLLATAQVALPLAIAGGLWAAYCYSINGHALPNTFYVKTRNEYPLTDAWTVVREIPWRLTANFYGSALVLYMIGAAALLRRPSVARVVIVLFPWVFLAAIGATRSMLPTFSNHYVLQRYALPAAPLLLVVITVGLDALCALGRRRASADAATPLSTAALLGRIAALALGALALVRYPPELKRNADLFAWNCQNIREMQTALGKWVARYTASDATILLNDAGAIRYFGERNIIDLVGLNTHELALDREFRHAISLSATRMADYMKQLDARYLIIFPSWFVALTTDPEFRQRFRVIHGARCEHYTIMPGEQDIMLVYELTK